MPRFGFGRIHVVDERDREHPMLALLPSGIVLPKRATNQLGQLLNQGPYPYCVACAFTGWELAAPICDDLSKIDPYPVLYAKAQKLDGIHGPHDGTTGRAALKALQAEDRVGEYVWATTIDEMRGWLATKGTLCAGLPWKGGMMKTDRNGFIHATGSTEGGHETLFYGYDDDERCFFIRNSWGKWGWKKSGNCKISYDDFQALFEEGGDCCAAVELKVA